MVDLSTAAPPAASALKAMVAVLVRHALAWLAAGLVARGALDPGATDQVAGPLTDYLLAALAGGFSLVWGLLRANAAHGRWAAAWHALRGDAPPSNTMP